jgi:hypothetical protein
MVDLLATVAASYLLDLRLSPLLGALVKVFGGDRQQVAVVHQISNRDTRLDRNTDDMP